MVNTKIMILKIILYNNHYYYVGLSEDKDEKHDYNAQIVNNFSTKAKTQIVQFVLVYKQK